MTRAPVIVGFVSQKGGVGKSTLARALGAVIAHGGLKVKIADLDAFQQTVVEWERLRDRSRVEIPITVEAFDTAAEAIASAETDELVIIDAPAHANRATLEIAKAATFIVQPSGSSLDDLKPTVLLFHELTKAGIPNERLTVALCRIGSKAEEDMARAYLAKAGYDVLPGFIPERSAFRQAQNRGEAITEVSGRGSNADVDTLMRDLVERVGKHVTERDRKMASASGTRK